MSHPTVPSARAGLAQAPAFDTVKRALPGLLAWIIALALFFPIFWMTITAFKTERDAYSMSLIFTPTLDSFREVLARSDYFLFARNSILHNVCLALLGLSPLRWNPFIDMKRQGHIVEDARAALKQVGLDGIAERPLSQTSYGERRRVEIAMALAQKPKVLLLDEPFAGLSIDERRDVHRCLMGIPRDVTMVMIEHNMDVALEFAERITLLHFGEVIVEGTRSDVVNDPRTREVYLGH